MFHFTPLLGSRSESPAVQSLLEFDGGIRILIDLGWDLKFSTSSLRSIEERVSTLSFILLTHPTLDRLGAYVHCCKHIPHFIQIPVYATTPVIALGRALLIDLYETTPQAATYINTTDLPVIIGSSENYLLARPSREEIFNFFSLIRPLKFSQPHQPDSSPLTPSCNGITITAYGAGYTLGGTIWHIQHELENVVYTSGWSQARENLITGATWLNTVGGITEVIEPLRRPTTLICACRGLGRESVPGIKGRDEKLLRIIDDTIVSNGKVLISVDSPSRMLEIAYLLTTPWHQGSAHGSSRLSSEANIYIAARTGPAITSAVANMLEWIDDNARMETEALETATTRGKGVDTGRVIGLRRIRYLKTTDEIQSAARSSDPCVIIASDASMEWGLSQTVLRYLATDQSNTLILTERCEDSTASSASLGRQIWNYWFTQQKTDSTSSSLPVSTANCALLKTSEFITSELSVTEESLLADHLLALNPTQNTLINAEFPLEDVSGGHTVDDASSESSDSEIDAEDTSQQGRTLNLSAHALQTSRKRVGASEAETGINVLLHSKTAHDYDVREKRGKERMFPFSWHKTLDDEFGTAIRADDYLRAEERLEYIDYGYPSRSKNGDGQIPKRKWHVKDSNDNSRQMLRSEFFTNPDSGLVNTRIGDKAIPVDLESPHYPPDDQANQLEDEGFRGEDEPAGVGSVNKPCKLLQSSSDLRLELQVAYVDFSGLQEGRDLLMLIPMMQPRNLILIGGTQNETIGFGQECRESLRKFPQIKLLTPIVGQTLTLSMDTHAWNVRLDPQILKRLAWQHVKGLNIVALTGKLETEGWCDENYPVDEEGQVQKKIKVYGSELPTHLDTKVAPLAVLNVVGNQSNMPKVRHREGHSPHLGDLKLAALRQLIIASGHIAEFRGEGTLLVDGGVIVKKTNSNQVEVEAAAGGLNVLSQKVIRDCDASFYAVRKLIYDGLAMVAGM